MDGRPEAMTSVPEESDVPSEYPVTDTVADLPAAPAGLPSGAANPGEAKAVAQARRDAARRRARRGLGKAEPLDRRPSTRGLALPERIWVGAARLSFGLPLYGLTLPPGRPAGLAGTPPDPWPGDAAAGAAILRGHFRFHGQNVQSARTIWYPRGASAEWLEAMHGFGWLRDLRAMGTDPARRRARELMLDWVEEHRGWRDPAWRPEILGARVAAWISLLPFCATGADERFLDPVLRSLSRQTRHLARAVPSGCRGRGLVVALKGLIFGGLFLPGHQRRLAKGLRLLEREVRRQVLADGGHVQRSPATQLDVLRDLIEVRLAFAALNREPPPWIQGAIDRVTPMLRLFRHGDGGLALFNGALEGADWRIEMVLSQAEMRGKAPPQAPHAGFQRLQANRTVLVVDTGAPPAPGLDRDSHAGTLSFEMSVGKDRMIVNCGARPSAADRWRAALRSTPAHSTVTVDGVGSAEVLADGLATPPGEVLARREQADGAVWLEARHDGYLGRFGLIHTRRLYLSANGEDLRGEDVLSGPGGQYVTARFHLHPSVQAGLTRDGRAVLLRLPNGTGWRMLAAGGRLSIADSIYAGGDELRRSRQIVIEGALEGSGATLRWALRREMIRP